LDLFFHCDRDLLVWKCSDYIRAAQTQSDPDSGSDGNTQSDRHTRTVSEPRLRGV